MAVSEHFLFSNENWHGLNPYSVECVFLYSLEIRSQYPLWENSCLQPGCSDRGGSCCLQRGSDERARHTGGVPLGAPQAAPDPGLVGEPPL